MNPFYDKQSNYVKGPRHFLAVLTVVLYVLLILNTYSFWGIGVSFLTALPVIIIPFLYGLKLGLISYLGFTVVIAPLLISIAAKEPLFKLYFEYSYQGLIVAFFISLLVGLVHDLQDRVHRLNVKLNALSRVDALTKLYNRRAFYEYLESEFIRTKRKLWKITHGGASAAPERFDGVFTVVLIDMDYFKSINDTFGHVVGDFVLREIASILQTKGIGFRDSDIVGRFGGEEFIVLLPETTGKEALWAVARIRRKLKEIIFTGQQHEKFSVNFSCGIAQIKDTDITSNDLISRADKALFYAKQNGRDQFYFYDDLLKAGVSLYEGSGRI